MKGILFGIAFLSAAASISPAQDQKHHPSDSTIN